MQDSETAPPHVEARKDTFSNSLVVPSTGALPNRKQSQRQLRKQSCLLYHMLRLKLSGGIASSRISGSTLGTKLRFIAIINKPYDCLSNISQPLCPSSHTSTFAA